MQVSTKHLTFAWEYDIDPFTGSRAMMSILFIVSGSKSMILGSTLCGLFNIPRSRLSSRKTCKNKSFYLFSYVGKNKCVENMTTNVTLRLPERRNGIRWGWLNDCSSAYLSWVFVLHQANTGGHTHTSWTAVSFQCWQLPPPEINGRVVVLRGGSEYMAHDKYDKCNLKTIFLELARILIDITHQELFYRAQAMHSCLIHFKGWLDEVDCF